MKKLYPCLLLVMAISQHEAQAQFEERILLSSQVAKHVLVQRSSESELWFEECNQYDELGHLQKTPQDCEKISFLTIPNNSAAVTRFNEYFSVLFHDYADTFAKENRPTALTFGFYGILAGGMGGLWAGVRSTPELANPAIPIPLGKLFRGAGYGALAAAAITGIMEWWDESNRRKLYAEFNPLEATVPDRTQVSDVEFQRFYEDIRFLLLESLENYNII